MAKDNETNFIGKARHFASDVGKADTTSDLVLTTLAQYETRLQGLLDQADNHKRQMSDTLTLFRQVLSQRQSNGAGETGLSNQRTQAQWQDVLGRVLSEDE